MISSEMKNTRYVLLFNLFPLVAVVSVVVTPGRALTAPVEVKSSASSCSTLSREYPHTMTKEKKSFGLIRWIWQNISVKWSYY